MRQVVYFLLFFIASVYISPALAQDTDEGDDYSDYSYLWEDSKEKEKEAKRKAKEERKRQKRLEKLRKKGLLPDSLKQDTVKLPVDSLDQPLDSLKKPSDSVKQLNRVNNTSYDTMRVQEQFIPEDTIPKDTIPEKTIPKDTIPDEKPIIEEGEPEDTEIEEEKSEKEKKEKRDISGPPVEDFRSGMGTQQTGGSFNGGFTYTVIDDKQYVGMTLSPEFNLGKVGVGLNVPVLYGLDDKKIRTEIFKDGVGIARLITYLRLGVQKKDPVYVKVGSLDNTMIGFGGLINNYTNTTSFEKRKVGLHYDFNLKGLAGIDGLYSDFNFTSLNLLAVRPYVRPIAWTSIPIVRTFELGATFVRDKDQTKQITSDSTFNTYNYTKEGIGAFGLDAGMTLLRVPFIQIDLFGTYSKLNVTSDSLNAFIAQDTASIPTLEDGFKNGSGASVGLNFRFHFIADLLATDIRIERLKYTEHYLPQFFDATYEINKDGKIESLIYAESMSGTYGSLTGHILQKVELGGSLMIPDNISKESPAVVRVNAQAERIGDKFSLYGSYIKGDLSDLKDAFKFDERSLAKLRFIYHMNKFLAVGLDYYWAFTPTADGGYKPTKYVSPYFGLSIAF